jgi:hypothetical protein
MQKYNKNSVLNSKSELAAHGVDTVRWLERRRLTDWLEFLSDIPKNGCFWLPLVEGDA